MKFSIEEFRAWENKKVTLLGMSGVGKTYLSTLLRSHNWFHYSGDYRIGTRYLDESILDIIKQQAMQIPFLRELLRRDWIYIRNNIKVDDLGPVLSFVGKLGDPERGGVSLEDFVHRQAKYREAEIAGQEIALFEMLMGPLGVELAVPRQMNLAILADNVARSIDQDRGVVVFTVRCQFGIAQRHRYSVRFGAIE